MYLRRRHSARRFPDAITFSGLVVLLTCTTVSPSWAGDTGVAVNVTSLKASYSGYASDWVTAPWIGDDAPYEAAREDIDRDSGRGDKMQRMYAEKNDLASAHPHDPVFAFSYAYVAWSMRKSFNTDQQVQSALFSAERALSSVPYPNAYNFARIRFLITARLGPARELEWMGKRLLNASPGDFEVKYRYACILMETPNGGVEKERVLPLINEMIAASPTNSDAYLILGALYLDVCNKVAYNAENVDAALNAYDKYLQLADPKYYARPGIEGIVRGLERIKANGYKLPAMPDAGRH